MVYKAAFVSSDGENVDRHFGRAEQFYIYLIDEEEKKSRLIEVRGNVPACDQQTHSHSVESLENAYEQIRDCRGVFAECIGDGARGFLAERGIQAFETPYTIDEVLHTLLYSKVKLIYRQIHPCMGGTAHQNYGRLHLPVSPVCNIQCRFCKHGLNKTEIRPGVSSVILKPSEAVETVGKALELCPQLSVVGIAGPGDTLATDNALDTFALVREAYPKLLSCLSTNGLYLPQKADRIADLGIETVTVTVNAVNPEILTKICAWVTDENGERQEGVPACQRLIHAQLAGIRKLADRGVFIKINTVLVPGINDGHISEIARTVKEAGATLMNIIPLLPQQELADVPEPDCRMLEKARADASQYLEIFTHCKRCRADACGIPGKGEDLHEKLYEGEVAETFSHG